MATQLPGSMKDPVRRANPLTAWFDVRRKSLGTWAFALNRLTGLGLVVYLFFHLAVLSLLLQGPESWDAFVALARSPLFLLLDVVLIFGLLYHALNGIRVALLGFGVGIHAQRTMFWMLMGLTAVLFLAAAYLVLTI